MQFEGRILPDAVTFLCLLNACSRSGYVNEGKYHFENMSRSYGIAPDLQHYTCMVDLFGRIGKFDEVITWTKDLPAVDHPFWCAFLGACQKWDNVKLGRLAFEKAVQLDDTHGAAYMHLANMYAAPNMQKT
jgi:pentatricopeptide repeat protein